VLLMQAFATRKETFLVIVSVIAVFSFMIIGAAQAQTQPVLHVGSQSVSHTQGGFSYHQRY
jgi:hypothetical protein